MYSINQYYLALFLYLITSSIAPCYAMDPPVRKMDYCINDEALAELEQLCSTIITQFPSDEYFYIGIGRSPTPIMAWLKNKLGDEAGIQIPLTRFRLCRVLPEDSISEPSYPSAEAEGRLFRYFDQFLRRHVGAGKKWLVIDTVMYGNTLRSSGFALTNYLVSHEQPPSVEMLAVSENDQEASYYTDMGMHVVMVGVDENEILQLTALESQLLHGGCKPAAPFGELPWQQIANEDTPPQFPAVNPKPYQYLMERIASRVAGVILATAWILILYKDSKNTT